MLFKIAALTLIKITVVVYNSEAVPAPELVRAQTIAGRILRQAGIEILWRPAAPGDLAPHAFEIPLHLLSIHPPTLSVATSGYAILMGDGSYAGVSYPAVRKSASGLDAPESTVLGAVMAHELGHILLGSRDHSTTGIMVMRFGAREIQAAARGELQFLRPEIHRIRARAQAQALWRSVSTLPCPDSSGHCL